MSIRVKEGKVRHNGTSYAIDEVITGLSKEEEARLISLGFAEKVEADVKSKNADANAKTANVQKEKSDKYKFVGKKTNEKVNPKENDSTNPDEKAEKTENEEDDDADNKSGESNAEGTETNPEDIQINFNPDDVISQASANKVSDVK